MDKVFYSDDIKETIALASKLARKAGRTPVQDRDYLAGLLLTHRRFNYLDALLREMGTSAPIMRRHLQEFSQGAPVMATSDLLKNAELIAQASQNGQASKQPLRVELEDLLKALCVSADPGVRKVFEEHRISPEQIERSVKTTRKKQFPRTVLYVAKELTEVVVFVLVFLILIKSFLGELRLIPSESMVPGLQINDRLVIERVTRWTRPYERGDILVFYPPMTQLNNDPWSLFLRWTGFSGLIYKKEENIDVAYIKRLIALPGDTVMVKPNEGVYVNGKKLTEPYISELASTCTIMKELPAQGLEPTCGAIEVPPDHYYLMGDNRNLSLDSRYWGFAEHDRVIGRAVFRIWPLERIGALPQALSQTGDGY